MLSGNIHIWINSMYILVHYTNCIIKCIQTYIFFPPYLQTESVYCSFYVAYSLSYYMHRLYFFGHIFSVYNIWCYQFYSLLCISILRSRKSFITSLFLTNEHRKSFFFSLPNNTVYASTFWCCTLFRKIPKNWASTSSNYILIHPFFCLFFSKKKTNK